MNNHANGIQHITKHGTQIMINYIKIALYKYVKHIEFWSNFIFVYVEKSWKTIYCSSFITTFCNKFRSIFSSTVVVKTKNINYSKHNIIHINIYIYLYF